MSLKEKTPDEDFTAAFASFSKDDKPADDAPIAEVKEEAPVVVVGADAPGGDDELSDGGEQPDAAGAEAPAADGDGGDAVAAADGGDPAPVAEAAVETPAAVEKDADTDAILAKLSKLVKEAPVEEEPAKQVTATEESEDLYDADEKTFLEGYEKDWGDVVKGEALKRRAEYRALAQHIFREIAKEFTPIREITEALAERTQLGDLKTAVPDYSDDLRGQVVAWVDQQPAYLQTAYKQVIQQGTVDEVTDLIKRYQKESGAGTPAKTSEKKEPELSSATKQAAAALAPVSSKRSVVQQQDDPSNFEAAFARFAASTD
jgi:hypothetical protein